MDAEQAAEALANANNAGEQAEAPAGGTPEQPAQSDSFVESVNPDDLPPELQGIYKQMQADYTRKTQTVAEKAKAIEALGEYDPQFARQAAEFYQNLTTNPEYAKQVYEQLEQALEQQGVLDEEFDLGDDYSDTGTEDPRVQQLEQRLQTFEQKQAVMENLHVLQRQESAIRENHPEYGKEDFERIYTLAYSHNGDLLQAEQAYQEWKQGIISQYMQVKADVPEGVQHVPASAPASQPREIKSIDEGHQAALEYLRNQL